MLSKFTHSHAFLYILAFSVAAVAYLSDQVHLDWHSYGKAFVVGVGATGLLKANIAPTKPPETL